MTIKILNVNRKILLGMFAVALVITVIAPLVLAYKPYTVGIQVKYPTGKPVVGAEVTIYDFETDLQVGNVEYTGNGGWVRLPWTVENHTYKVTASYGNYRGSANFTTNEKASALVKLSLSDLTVVSVTVVNETGYPVGDAIVTISNETNDIVIFGSTDENGIVIFDALNPETTYTATAYKDSLSGFNSFTTNSFGGANVLVTMCRESQQ